MVSVGIILYNRSSCNTFSFFVGHPGGIFFTNKDIWYFFKGGVEKFDKNYIDTAIREFREETNVDLSEHSDKLTYLGSVKQNKKKIVHAFCCDYSDIPNFDVKKCKSNLVELEVGKGSGVFKEFPEIDDYKWMDFDELKNKTNEKHLSFYEQIMMGYEN